MSVTRVGATKKYSDNWQNIFGGGNSRTASKHRSAANVGKSNKAKTAKAKAKRPVKKSARKK